MPRRVAAWACVRPNCLMRLKICRASSALTWSSPDCSSLNPRSANTLPMPRVTRTDLSPETCLLLIGDLLEPPLVIGPRPFQAGLDQIDLMPGRFDPARALLLECVKNVDRLGESDGVHGAVRIARMILHDL